METRWRRVNDTEFCAYCKLIDVSLIAWCSKPLTWCSSGRTVSLQVGCPHPRLCRLSLWEQTILGWSRAWIVVCSPGWDLPSPREFGTLVRPVTWTFTGQPAANVPEKHDGFFLLPSIILCFRWRKTGFWNLTCWCLRVPMSCDACEERPETKGTQIWNRWYWIKLGFQTNSSCSLPLQYTRIYISFQVTVFILDVNLSWRL